MYLLPAHLWCFCFDQAFFVEFVIIILLCIIMIIIYIDNYRTNDLVGVIMTWSCD